MAIMNYTTSVAISKTVGDVTTSLTRRGVSRISTLFDGDSGVPSGLGFTYKTEFGVRDFELPINVDGVLKALQKDAEPRYRTKEQAARVAWRIAKDWLDAQMALIDANLATVEQVFLPYMVVDAAGGTMYQAVRKSALAELEMTVGGRS